MSRYDVIPTFFTLLSLYLFLERRQKWAYTSMAIGAMFKIFPALLDLIYLKNGYQNRRGWRYYFELITIPAAIIFSSVLLLILFTDEYKTALWLRDRVGQDYRVYVMYGNKYRGAQWLNAFSPETKQVLGGYDQGASMVDRTPFLFDDMVKGGADADELHDLAVEYHVKYIVIDDSFIKGSGPSYMKFYEEEHFRSADEINGELAFAKVFEVKGVEPLPDTSVSYHYWDRWRLLGIAGTILLIPLFLVIYKKLKLSLV